MIDKPIYRIDISDIKQIVLMVRESVKRANDCENLSGLCNIAVIKIMDTLRSMGADDSMLFPMHGELIHSPKIESKYWPMQHTMLKLVLGDQELWIDPTSGQFDDIIPGVPHFIISNTKPWWFYPDMNNPAFSGITRYINKINIPLCIEGRVVEDGLVEFCQYNIWGNISDLIRKFMIKK